MILNELRAGLPALAIDGSKFKAVNHRDRNFTSAKLERRMRDIEASFSRYLVQMDTADRQEPTIAKAKTERLQDKIAALKEQMQILKQVEVQLDAAPDKQVSLADPDARSMKTRETGVVGFNVQVAVDAKHHLIVAPRVTNNGIDRDQLTSMAKLARTEMGVDKLTAVAEKGYYKSEEILACHETGITAFVPKTKTSGATSDGRFGKEDFIYDAEKNEYRCPAGERLIRRYRTTERGVKLDRLLCPHAVGERHEVHALNPACRRAGGPCTMSRRPHPKTFARAAPDVVGSWSLVSLTVTISGSKVEVLGPHPHGQLIFGSDGRYVLVGVRADLPRFAADSRLSGTAEKNQRIVQGNFAHFGTYTVIRPDQ